MYKTICAALIAAAVIGSPLAAFAQQEMPRAYSQEYWPAMDQTAAAPAFPAEGTSAVYNWQGTTGYVNPPPVSGGNPIFAGPRPSSAH
jgi:hypothetical protein